ncbi:hypothetical protein T459_28746 [Capsicum annuum]|uniref:R13L1/DRL21-like LRR repeat region domain-containing protein n=1 Tax=Capsicum annuum TaxID=4072 RepID=A0A2G2YHS5_CAPAN|nr:hypothetical protein FXO37_20811 [Capsicum annuum]PHT69259.1 hypothetical protein T459_28746 [Capsicum annuum]
MTIFVLVRNAGGVTCNQCFSELRSRSLFKRVPESSERDGGKFLMHDLVNDLAQIASSKLCVRLEECQGSHMLEQSRHMSYSKGEGGDFEKLKLLSKSEQLRTVIPIQIQLLLYARLSKRVLHNILPMLTSLRALSLSDYEIVELPDALFIRLKLLRFLNLSRTEIKKLPDSICVLYNLETVLLSSCDDLEELPLQMEKLINLRHLDISNTSRLKMLLHLSKLKSIQVLVGAKFLLGGLRMEDLGELHNLYGSLSILALQNVVDGREAQKAKMSEKNHVEKLSLEWSEKLFRCRKLKLETPDSSKMNSNVFLEGLRLDECDSISSPELVPRARYLDVESCQHLARFLIPIGTETLHISWCESLEILSVECGTQMTSLDIHDCKKLKRLPEHMQELLPSLKELQLSRCPEIESFPDGGLPFNLQLLTISSCEKLVNGQKEWRLQRLPSLRVLCIHHDGSDEEFVDGANWELPSSIQMLNITNLKTLSSQHLKSLTSLECLYTEDLPQIQSLLEQGLPSSLSELCLYGHGDLHSLPTEGLRHLTSLQSLEISNCHQLHSLPESGLPSSLSELTITDCPNLQSLPESVFPSSLSNLTIKDFPNLQSLPVKGMSSSLSSLSIYKCPLLKPLLEFDKGEYWPEIAHISTTEIDWGEYLQRVFQAFGFGNARHGQGPGSGRDTNSGAASNVKSQRNLDFKFDSMHLIVFEISHKLDVQQKVSQDGPEETERDSPWHQQNVLTAKLICWPHRLNYTGNLYSICSILSTLFLTKSW